MHALGVFITNYSNNMQTLFLTLGSGFFFFLRFLRFIFYNILEVGVQRFPTKPVFPHMYAAATAKSLQSCLTLCDPIDGSPPGSPVPGILQARTLEWVAISFSNA